jgi:hypothetical protein
MEASYRPYWHALALGRTSDKVAELVPARVKTDTRESARVQAIPPGSAVDTRTVIIK